MYLWHMRRMGWWTGAGWSTDFSKARAFTEAEAFTTAKQFNGDSLAVLVIRSEDMEAARD